MFCQSGYSGKCCRLFICDWSTSVLIANLHCNCSDVSFFARKDFIIYGFSTVVFGVKNLDGVFLLRVSGKARFFPAVQVICKFGSFIKIS